MTDPARTLGETQVPRRTVIWDIPKALGLAAGLGLAGCGPEQDNSSDRIEGYSALGTAALLAPNEDRDPEGYRTAVFDPITINGKLYALRVGGDHKIELQRLDSYEMYQLDGTAQGGATASPERAVTVAGTITFQVLNPLTGSMDAYHAATIEPAYAGKVIQPGELPTAEMYRDYACVGVLASVPVYALPDLGSKV